MKRVWYRWLWHAMLHLHYRRVAVFGEVPSAGGVLYVGLHRNGAVDGLAYAEALPGWVTFVASVQWSRGVLRRLLFSGISLSREKDGGDSAGNVQALQRAADILRSGEDVFIMPEGTSSLGPQPLRIRSGAARIAHLAMAAGASPLIAPVGINYPHATAYGSDVEVVFGRPFRLGGSESVADIQREIEARLLDLAPRFDSDAAQSRAEIFSNLNGSSPQHATLTACSKAMVAQVERVNVLESLASQGGLLRWHRAAIAASEQPIARLLAGGIGLTAASLLMLLNAPPLLAAWIAGKRLADGCNVIVLWRLLIGLPAVLAWWLALAALAWPLALVAIAAAFIAPKIFDAALKRFVAGWNGWRSPEAARLCAELRLDCVRSW